MNFSDQRFLHYLAEHQGQELSYKDIKQSVQNIHDPKKKKLHSSRKPLSQGSQLDILILELLNFGLLSKKREKFIVKKPFLLQAELSVSKSGVGFAVTNGILDILIPTLKRNGANARDQVMIKIINKRRNRYEGEVASIIKHFTKNFMAKVLEKKKKFYLVKLIDMPDQPFSALRINQKRVLALGDYVEVQIENQMISMSISSEHGSRIQKIFYSSCVVRSTSSHINPALRRIALKYSLPLEYPLEHIPTKKLLQNKFESGMRDKKRINLENLYACTIDGDDAKDFDDAISMETKGEIKKVYVHIADVSYFVEKGSPSDRIAFERGNSYYLKPSVLPMLPSILSEEYCSLKPQTKRLTVTCEMDFDDKLQLVKLNFYRSIVYISQRFTYSEAEKDINLHNDPLDTFWKFAKRLRLLRLQRGGIDIGLSDAEILFDSQGKPKEVQSKKQLQSHQLIEELMLIANISAAKFCKKNKIPGLHRVHEPMDKAKLEGLNQLLGFLGSKQRLKNIAYTSLTNSINSLKKAKDKEVFSYAILRSFMQANYESTPRGHWGLGFRDYAHFTSPIRRYSDLIVHRQILSWQEKKGISHKVSELKTFGIHVSQKERIALEAERSLFKLLTMSLLEKKMGELFTARLIGFNQAGLFVMLNTSPIEGFIPVSSFDKKSQITSPNQYQVVITKYGKTTMIGEEFTVRYIKPDWDNMKSIFHLQI